MINAIIRRALCSTRRALGLREPRRPMATYVELDPSPCGNECDAHLVLEMPTDAWGDPEFQRVAAGIETRGERED